MKTSYWVAASVLLASIAWMASGRLDTGKRAQGSDSDGALLAENTAMMVEVSAMQASEITAHLIAQGNLISNRSVVLRAEVPGQVEALLAQDGARLARGEPILRLRPDDRAIRREQALLKIEEKERQAKATRNLRERGFGSQSELDTAEVELKMAQVELAQIELEIEKTTIVAPFEGILEERMVDVGDFVSVGNEVVTLVDNDPLVVQVRVPQRSVQYVQTGDRVRVMLLDGRELEGQIRFIASRGDEATRTFRVEINVPNPEGLRAGGSATAFIPRGNIRAHFISGSLLSLDVDGQMGVKTVEADGRVGFYPVKIELAEGNGMWVSGLPDRARVITSGQGFVRVGDRVLVVDEGGALQQPFSQDAVRRAQGEQHAQRD